jgi:cytochrome c551/c552
MKTQRESALSKNEYSEGVKNRQWRRSFGILASWGCIFLLAAFLLTGLARSASSANPIPSHPQAQSSTAAQPHGGDDLSGKTPDELAAYLFEHHGCNSCHTLGQGGKLGFTDRGKEVGKNFEGCISLLTSMNVIAQTKAANRTTEEKQKAARFKEFGCTTCHQIVPGKLGLTEYGKKLKSMHMACTDVEKILAK